MAQVFERGLTNAVGLRAAGPALERQAARPPLGSEKWKTRRGKLFLVPGDSPGRLPPAARHRCRYVPPAQYPYIVPVDPSMPRGPLPDARGTCRSRPIEGATSSAPQAAASFTAEPTTQQERVEQELGEIGGAVRTALTVEPRDGRLCVFMPPVEALEDYLELIAAAEDAAQDDRPAGPYRGLRAAARPAPQRHPRRARSRRHRGQHPPGLELGGLRRDHHGDLRGSAPVRLGADKFMIDGRHTGTGGGNHVVVGGATPNDSPFLRRPDLLKSLVLHWQRHPSLSYLFSGLFIGPTSQAPRFDEARHDSLYELEIAHGAGAAPGQGRRAPALAGRPAVPQPADRRHRQHPPLRNLHRQAVFARRPDRPARPRRVPRLRDAAQCAHEPCPAAAGPRPHRPLLEDPARRHASSAGARRCTTASCCRTIVWADFLDVLADLEQQRLRLPTRNGSRRSSSSASRSAARSNTRASSSSSARRWSPGTSWANRAPSAAPCASSIPRSSGCR